MRKFLALLLCIVSIQSFSQKTAVAIADKRFAGIEKELDQLLKDWHAAGFAIAVVEKDKIIYSKGFGYRDVEKKLPATPNTLFAIGSVTKSFTASLIGLLEKDGKLDINKPASGYLPSLKFYNDAMNNTVTLSDMMSHRTGLPRHDFSWYLFSTDSRDSILQRIKYQEPTAPIRHVWQYNNFMFTAQAAIAEKITGKSWEENISERFLKPLGMTNTNLDIKALETYTEPAVGYGLKKDSIIKKLDYYKIASMAPAGSINSSVNEMANWVITWINGGKFKGKEILPAKYVSQAITSQSIVNPGFPSKEKPDLHFATYGFGWALSSYKGHYRVDHGGNIDGFSANASFFPTDSIGIIVLTNQDGSRIPSLARNIIADRLLGQKYFDWNADAKTAFVKAKAQQAEAKKTATSSKKPNTTTSHPVKDYSGIYNNPGYGDFNLYVNNDSLFAQAGSQALWLRHFHYDVFDPFVKDKIDGIDTVDGALPMKLQFAMNTTGDIEGFSIPFEAGLKPLIFTKQLKPIALAANDLQKYVGDYDLNGAAIKVYVKNNVLYALVPGQPDYELVPVDKDKFGLKVASGYFTLFGVDANNKVKDMTFIQPNGNYTAIKK
ncbi:MAG TPA: serine hydrolase [Segetibacter sp.]|jgi:CubicO group peptidase (beta-lactamase class C family)